MADRDTAAAGNEGRSVAIAHQRLRDAILSGRIPAGPTSQVALAALLGVGRTPLRESIRMLQREGLVIPEPNRRLRIAELSPADAEELYVMRIALESTAIQITVAGIDSGGIAELEGLLAQISHYMRNQDGAGMRRPHRDFHRALVAGAGPRVGASIDSLFDHAERYRVAFGATSPEVWRRRHAEHRAILDAVATADARGAARLLVGHYGETARLVFAGLDPNYRAGRLEAATELLTD